jgi:hypothetical protein
LWQRGRQPRIKAIEEISLRSAQPMGAPGRQVFWYVMLQGLWRARNLNADMMLVEFCYS